MLVVGLVHGCPLVGLPCTLVGYRNALIDLARSYNGVARSSRCCAFSRSASWTRLAATDGSLGPRACSRIDRIRRGDLFPPPRPPLFYQKPSTPPRARPSSQPPPPTSRPPP